MRVIYIADDGTQFDNEFECELHEWKFYHPHAQEVRIFDAEGNELKDVLEEETYHNSVKIVVPNEEALKDFQAFADYSGYCAYSDIDQVGTWVLDERYNFIKSE